MKIISISGLDGSGKSTQIELLSKHLESKGKKVFYFHSVTFSVANILKIQNTKHKIQNTKSITRANWLQIQLRKLALCIDLIRFKKLVKKLENKNVDYLLSDRYFYDNLINITYLSNKNVSCSMLYVPCFMKIPRPDFAFYLQTDPEIIMKRDRVPDQGLEYLQKKKELLDTFSAKEQLRTIDGNLDAKTIHEEIKKEIGL